MDTLIRFLKGYLRIKITGQEPIRFLNLCQKRGIILWNVDYKDKRLRACMNISDYFLLHDILRKTGTKATVTAKNGLPFFVPKIQKKTIFLITFLLIFFYLWDMSNYIWRIEFNGNYHITDEQIDDFLLNNDIRCGTRKRDIDIDKLEEEIRKAYPQITWVCISFENTRMSVSIKENPYLSESTNMIKQNGTNITANKPGKIVSIITRNGIPCVKPGDTVNVGDILVDGRVPVYDENGEIMKYQVYDADATIIADTLEHYHHMIENTYEEKIYTGRIKKYISLDYQRQEFVFPHLPSKYELYDSVRIKTQLKIWKHFYLPLFCNVTCEREYIKETRKYTMAEKKKLLYDDLEKIMLSFDQKGVQIIQKNVRIKENANRTELSAVFFLHERIGIATPISDFERDREADIVGHR